jgi:DNA-binding IclR family transcriptional regulator
MRMVSIGAILPAPNEVAPDHAGGLPLVLKEENCYTYAQHMHEPKPKSNYMSGVPAVEQTVAILSHLSSVPRFTASLTDISKSIGIGLSKALAILNTLEKFRYVTRDIDGKKYALGLSLVPLGHRAMSGLNYADIVKPFAQALARETRSTALFAIINDKNLIVIVKEASGQEVDSRISLGRVLSLFYRATGRAIAAFLPNEEREKLLNKQNCGFHSDPAKLKRAELERELKICREKGFAVDLGTVNPIIKTIASPVLGVDGYPKGVLFITGIMKKSAIPANGTKVARKARELSATFGWIADDVNNTQQQ